MSWTHLLTHFFNDKAKWELLVGEKGVFKVNIINAIINISKNKYKNHPLIHLKLINSPIFLIKSFNPGYFDNDFFTTSFGKEVKFDNETGILTVYNNAGELEQANVQAVDEDEQEDEEDEEEEDE